ncbi:MAG: Lrp/AsnC family transcriptional regulator [Bacteroidales bacterium]|nr:Lrp/AsnC family transcriptional regulator [Bacteroidales bacterium]
MENLDSTDIKLLTLLQQNSNLTTKEIASKVSLSTTPVFERIKRLEREGYIKKYVAILDAEKLNQDFVVFCHVKLKQLNTEIANNFTASIKEIAEVTECYNISGHFDYMLKIHASNMKQYQDFIINKLGRLDSLGSLESVFVMDTVKQDYKINI